MQQDNSPVLHRAHATVELLRIISIHLFVHEKQHSRDK